MDEVHHEFVDIVGAMQRAKDEELSTLPKDFTTHAQAHFDAENAWMVETDFPARECHIDEHAAVMRSVLGFAKAWPRAITPWPGDWRTSWRPGFLGGHAAFLILRSRTGCASVAWAASR